MADISRNDVAGLIQDAYRDDFAQAAGTSQVLQTFTTVDMGTKTQRMPVLATIPHAQWVGESATDAAGVKPTSKATWENKELVAEEVAVIIPVHENVVDDANEDILASLARLGGQACGYALDAAVLFGSNKPATWTSPDLFAAATAAGQLYEVGTGTDDLGGSILQAAGGVADQGFEPSDVLARAGLRYQLANLRNNDGTPIFLPSLSSAPGAADSIQGLTARWIKGTIEGDLPVWNTDATALVVDRERVRIGVRQDITVKFLDQATVGGINLAERDMVALRFKARYAYVLGNFRAENNEGGLVTKTPVAAVTPAAAV